MAVPIISFPQSAFPFKTSTSAKSAAAGLRASKDATVLRIADTFDTLTASVNAIENLIRSCRVVDEAWFKMIGIGGTGYGNAPFRVALDGTVALRTPDLVDVGWLGAKFDAAKNVTGAVTAGGLIRLTVATHGYVTGNTVRVADVGGVPNATGYWVATRVNANQFDLVGSTFAGVFTTGGSATRYFGGAWFQTLFVGGSSAASAKLVADAAGNLSITNALISLTNGTKSIVLDPLNASITVADTTPDAEGIFAAGVLTFHHISVATPSISIGYDPLIPGSTLGISATNLSGATSFKSYYFDAGSGNTLRRADSQISDGIDVYSAVASYRMFMDRFQGTVETPAAALTGDYLGDLTWRAARGSPLGLHDAAQIRAVATTVVPGAGGGILCTLSFSTSTLSGMVERLTILGDKIGIANAAPTATLDVGGTVRSTGIANPTSGEGTEIRFDTGTHKGTILAYDRSGGGGFLDLILNGAVLYLNSGSHGDVLVGTATDTAGGGLLQVKGHLTPNTDGGHDLGTVAVQWKDLRLSGSIYSAGTVGITQIVPLAKLTALGTDGSVTFVGGIPTAYSAPT